MASLDQDRPDKGRVELEDDAQIRALGRRLGDTACDRQRSRGGPGSAANPGRPELAALRRGLPGTGFLNGPFTSRRQA